MFIDTHIDTLWAMNNQNREFYEKSDQGHVDLSRAEEAGLLAGLFTGFPTDSHYTTEYMLKQWIQMVRNPKNKMKQIFSYQDLLDHKTDLENNKPYNVGTILTLEGATGIDSGLNRLYIYYHMGLRAMGLTWNETNQFATGQEGDKSRGLTQEGKDLVGAMEDLGILIDVSHLNDKSFWEVVDRSNGPIFASHSNVRKLAQHNRNLLDEMIVAIADSGGSIGINLYKAFLENDASSASMKSVISMFEKVIDLTSPSNVHSGADLDGADLPEDMKDIRSIPTMFTQLKADLSLSDDDLKNIQYGNMMRVMKSCWK